MTVNQQRIAESGFDQECDLINMHECVLINMHILFIWPKYRMVVGDLQLNNGPGNIQLLTATPRKWPSRLFLMHIHVHLIHVSNSDTRM